MKQIMNSQLLEKVEKTQILKRPEIKAGDLVRVHQKIKEGKKERVQVFEGVVLRVKGAGLRRSFIVRKISFGVGVEKCFLLNSPNIEKIEVKKRAQVRRAYLTYLRKLTGKKARLKDQQFDSLIVNVQEEEVVEENPSTDTKDNSGNSEKAKKAALEDEKDASNDASKEAMLDKEVTELDAEQVADSNIEEVPLSEVEKEENKEIAAEDEKGKEDSGDDHQATQVEEVEKGIEEAEDDIEKGKNKDTDKSEKTVEDQKVEETKE